MDTKSAILNASRNLFNKYGLSGGTARAICRQIKISPGSFSYHYPDKRLILIDLYEQMVSEINSLISQFANAKPSIRLYLDFHKELFKIQYRYRYFYLNLFEVLNDFPEIKKLYKEQINIDRATARTMILLFMDHKILSKDLNRKTIDRLIDVGQLLNTFWLSDAAIMQGKNENQKDMMFRYMKICCGLLEPYLEPPSLRAYNQFFREMENI